jgi:hypothetical protein
MILSRVYAKTEAGETAVEQRTRLAQRNWRNVLIFVDGKSSLDELARKVGSESMVIDAIEHLEKDGFICLVESSQRPAEVVVVPDEEIVETVSAKKSGEKIEPTLAANVGHKSPFGGPAEAVTGNPFAPAKSPEFDAGPMSVPPAPDVSDPATASPFQTAPVANPFASAATPAAPLRGEATADVDKQPAKNVAAAGIPSSEPSSDSTTTIKRKRHHRPTWLSTKTALATMAAVVVVAILGILLFPYDKYKPQIEAALSNALGQPVSIGKVGARFSPAPTLVLTQVGIGKGGELAVTEVEAVPGVTSLFTDRKSFRRVSISGARVPVEQLGVFASSLESISQSKGFSVGSVNFARTTLSLRDVSVQDFSGAAEFGADGQLKRLALNSPDGRVKIGVETIAGKTNVIIDANGWTPGEGSPFVFDALNIQGELSGSRFVAQKIEGRIFGGVIQGHFGLDWSLGFALNGDISTDYMAADQVAKALKSESLKIDGQMNTRFKFKSAGASWAEVTGSLPLEGSFMAKNGGIYGIDLVEAVRRGNRLPMRGGTTKFEEIAGKFRLDSRALQLSDVDLTSGLVRASGAVGILRNGLLSGSLDVQLKGSATTVRTPVSVTGTLKDPQVLGGRR